MRDSDDGTPVGPTAADSPRLGVAIRVPVAEFGLAPITRDVLPEERWVAMTMEYADEAYGTRGRSSLLRGEGRFGRAMKLEGVSDGQLAAIEQARADYRAAWVGLFPRVVNSIEDQRAYRTADQFEGDEPGPHDEQVEQNAV